MASIRNTAPQSQPKNVLPLRNESDALIAAKALLAEAKSAEELNAPEIVAQIAALSDTEYKAWTLAVKANKTLTGSGFSVRNYNALIKSAKIEAVTGAFVPNLNGRPDIIIADLVQGDETINSILEALRMYSDDHGGVIYRREGQMVQVRARDDRNGYEIVEVSEAALINLILASANVYQQTISKSLDKRYKAITPSSAIVKAALHRENNMLQKLAGLVTSPIINEDGSLSQTVGYNERNHYIYRPADAPMPVVSDAPTRDEARASMAYLMHNILGGFAFADDGKNGQSASRANAAALLLTPALRRCYTGLVPMGVIEAPAAGSGKSFLARVIGSIYTGREIGMLGDSKDITQEEIQKTLLGVVQRRDEFLILDNVKGKFGSAHLERFLTMKSFDGRLLGSNRIVSGPNLTTPIMTSNNAQLSGDMWRRAYRIRIDTGLAHPENRPTSAFPQPNLLGWLLGEGGYAAHRPEVLHHIHTVLRAWFAAGAPKAKNVRYMANFEVWAETLASVLEFVGIEGFLANQDSVAADMAPEKLRWEAFMIAWWEGLGSQPVSATTLKRHIEHANVDLLGDAVGPSMVFEEDVIPAEIANLTKITAEKVSAMLRSHVGQPVGDAEYVLTAIEDKRRCSYNYMVTPRKPEYAANDIFKIRMNNGADE